MFGSASTIVIRRNAVGGTTSVLQSCEQPSPSFVLPSSHCSPDSTTPLPHTGAQSLSLLAFAPLGQQPSLLAGVVIGACVQRAVQADPTSVSVVHASPSSQLVGHASG